MYLKNLTSEYFKIAHGDSYVIIQLSTHSRHLNNFSNKRHFIQVVMYLILFFFYYRIYVIMLIIVLLLWIRSVLQSRRVVMIYERWKFTSKLHFSSSGRFYHLFRHCLGNCSSPLESYV